MATDTDRIMSKGDAVATVLTIGGYFGLRHLAKKERKRRTEALRLEALAQISRHQARLLMEFLNGKHDGDLAAFLTEWEELEVRRRYVNRWL